MNKNDYFNDYLTVEKSRIGLHTKLCNLRDSQLEWYESEVLKNLGLEKLKPRKENCIVEQILSTSLSDERKKMANKEYYIANIITYLSVIKKIISEDLINRFLDRSIADDSLLVYNYHHLLHRLLFDSIIVINEYNINVKNGSNIYPCWKSSYQHTLTIYRSLQQCIYGQSSFLELESDIAISLIRQLVELRLRRALGVDKWHDSEKGSEKIVTMKELFEVLETYKADIDFSIPLHCLKRINKWSNMFLHSGFKEYFWKPIFVSIYIKEFATGKSSAYDCDSGITTTQSVLDKIISDIEKLKGCSAIRCKPEMKLVNEQST